MSKIYKSDRGKVLHYNGGCPPVPVITVEDYMKWYSLFAVYPNGGVFKIDSRDLEEEFDYSEFNSSAVGDHVFNPMAVCNYAARNKMYVDSISLAAITRRWYNEYYDKGVCIEHFNTDET